MCILPDGTHIFIHDCVEFIYPEFGLIQGLVVKFIYQVQRTKYLILKFYIHM